MPDCPCASSCCPRSVSEDLSGALIAVFVVGDFLRVMRSQARSWSGLLRQKRHVLRECGSGRGAEDLVAAIGPCPWHQIAPESVTRLARCKLKPLRIRGVRLEMLAAIWECPVPARLQQLAGLERYERAALAKQKRALRPLRREGG